MVCEHEAVASGYRAFAVGAALGPYERKDGVAIVDVVLEILRRWGRYFPSAEALHHVLPGAFRMEPGAGHTVVGMRHASAGDYSAKVRVCCIQHNDTIQPPIKTFCLKHVPGSDCREQFSPHWALSSFLSCFDK